MLGKFLKKHKNADVYLQLISSVLSVCLCLVCLSGMTRAWFTANHTVGIQDISAARFIVEAVVTDSESKTVEPEEGRYTLSAGTYTVSLKNTGTATKGYCKISYADTKVGTINLADANTPGTLTFTVEANEPVTLKIESFWGTDTSIQTLDLNSEIITDGYTLVIGEYIAPVPIAFNFDGIDENIYWNPVVDWDDQLPYAGKDYSIYLAAKESYAIGNITIDIDGIAFTVYEAEATQLQENTEKSVVPAFDKETGILTIPAQLLTETTKQISISVTAVESAPEVTPTVEPTESPVPTATPEISPTPTVEPTPTATPSAEPSTQPSASPTADPTEEPAVEPTTTPDTNQTPEIEPTAEPTIEPTVEPTVEPTAEPTVIPTEVPTPEPEDVSSPVAEQTPDTEQPLTE